MLNFPNMCATIQKVRVSKVMYSSRVFFIICNSIIHTHKCWTLDIQLEKILVFPSLNPPLSMITNGKKINWRSYRYNESA